MLSGFVLLAASCGDEDRAPPAGSFGGRSGAGGGGSGTSGSGGSDAGACPTPPVLGGGCAGGSSYQAFAPADVDCALACDHAAAICATRGCSAHSTDLCAIAGASCVSECEAGKQGFGLPNATHGCAALVGDCACWASCVLAACPDLP